MGRKNKKVKQQDTSSQKEDKMIFEGTVDKTYPWAKFLVNIKMWETEYLVTGHLSWKMRKNFINIIEWDRVEIELTPYDLTKGRVIKRLKTNESVPTA